MDSTKALASQKENTLPSEYGTVSSISSKPMPNISFGGASHFKVKFQCLTKGCLVFFVGGDCCICS